MPGLGTSFGRGGATTAQWDLANSDCILITGSNMAECHPIAFRFVMEARERGATIIHVDPRFTRTSANADIFAHIRPGTDVAFLGGLIRHVIEHNAFFREYVTAYTNAANLLREDFRDTEDLGGVFSGYDADRRAYDTTTWAYQLDATGQPMRDETLTHERCVLQVLRRHFSRYTPEVVESLCGMPVATFERIAETLCANSGHDRTTAFCYAVGWTQHTIGVQNIRGAAILQALLGNIGRPGGGILALRGHATIQGSTDVPTLYNLLPGYLPMPSSDQPALADFYREVQTPTGWWHNAPKYMVSLLRAWFADAATAENDWAYHWLPKLSRSEDYSYYPMFFKMKDGKMRGLFVMGENFAVGGPGARVERAAMRQLDWCVVRDPFLVETANFWKADEVDPATVSTEVFYMPAAWPPEKDGSFTNTQRMLQWHEQAVEAPGDSRSETWFMAHLGLRLKRLYAGSTETRDEPLLHLTWDYPMRGSRQEPDAQAILEEINGYTVADGKQVAGFADLADDGSTACGCWIYSGVAPEQGVNRARGRTTDEPGERTNHSQWGWVWPANRRILYNRASADPDGQPWSERKRLIWWDAAKKQWTGEDVPDFPLTKAPHTAAQPGATGIAAHSGADPFIMQDDGRAWIYAPIRLKDGPLPAHYEPFESPVPNLLYPSQQVSPCVITFDRDDNPMHGMENPDYPYVLTTYRLTEHHTSGAMSRWSPWLAELQPELFCEIDPVLAARHGVANGDWVTISTARASVEARALVTERMRPLRVAKRQVHVIGLPYHWGPEGVVTGDVTNDLVGTALDPNVKIHEAKAFTCALRKGRRDQHEEAG